MSDDASSDPSKAPSDESEEYDDGEEYDDDEYEDDEPEEPAPEVPASGRASVAQLVGLSALCVVIGGMFAGAVLGVMMAADGVPPRVTVARINAPRVAAALVATPAVRPDTPSVDAATATDASAASDVATASDAVAVAVQESDPEGSGDGVMDDLDDGPPTPPRSASRAAVRAGVTPPRAAGHAPSHVVTSDNVPEGPAQGYVRGHPVRIEVTRLDGKPVERHTAIAYRRLYAAAEHDGVRLRIVSGFRTMEHQQALYRAWQRGHGNLAAVPGHSNHQSGHALDLNTSSPGVFRWLQRNGQRFGFRRTVPTEPWHWEWW